MPNAYFEPIDSPVGKLLLTCTDEGITALHMDSDGRKPPASAKRGHPLLDKAKVQLDEYFKGKRRDFDLPLAAQGTPFQRKVWQTLCSIPFAKTLSYGEVARKVGKPGASRAVGGANNRNPIGIIVPCHRVIGADGSLTGYGGGLDRKQWLLEHERASL